MDGKERILVVLPYGMCFRNIVLNADLWNYLTKTYAIDLMTPLRIANTDRLGIDTVYNYQRYKFWGRLRRKMNYLLLYCRKYLELADFYLILDMGEEFSIIYRFVGGPSRRRNLLLWGGLNQTKFGRLLKKALERFPFFYPAEPILKRNKYKFLLLGHNAENECILIARVANKLNVPVVCVPLGVDNIRSGPMFMTPDLLLLWGREQSHEFEKYQIAFNQELSRTVAVEIGSLVYDNYVREEIQRKAFLKGHGIEDGHEVILFPAYVESHYPGQTTLCGAIVNFIKTSNIKVKLLIRVRPNFDIEMWENFERSHRDVVMLQIPEGASYDKSGKRELFDLQKEVTDIKNFVGTIKHSSLVINPSFSTVYLDATALGTPAVVAAYAWGRNDSTVHAYIKEYMCNRALYPHWADVKVILSEKELFEFLSGFFIEGKRSGMISREFLSMRVTSPSDGSSGRRAMRAIEEYFRNRVYSR